VSNLAIIIIIGETILMLFYLIFYYRWGSKTVLGLKAATSLGFVVLGLLNLKQANELRAGTTVFIGLVCGFLGDIILGFRHLYRSHKRELFYGGLLLFFVGHVVYILAFLSLRSGQGFLIVLVALVLLAVVYLLSRHYHIDYGDAKNAVFAYMAVSSLLLSLVFINVISAYSKLKLLIFIGALSFVISDFLLSFIYFRKMSRPKIRLFKAVNIVSYYLGQTLFAVSICLM